MSKKTDKKTSKKSDKEGKKAKKSKQKKANKKLHKVTSEERLEMIATAAYYIAEGHGFTTGRTKEDWQEAERQIDRQLKKRK